jgi:hypothetical protein
MFSGCHFLIRRFQLPRVIQSFARFCWTMKRWYYPFVNLNRNFHHQLPRTHNFTWISYENFITSICTVTRAYSVVAHVSYFVSDHKQIAPSGMHQFLWRKRPFSQCSTFNRCTERVCWRKITFNKRCRNTCVARQRKTLAWTVADACFGRTVT